MAHLGCKCGNLMWNGRVPNDIEFAVFSYIRSCELVENPPKFSTDPIEFICDLNDLFAMADYEVWRCPECGRLYVFDNHDDSHRAKYVYRLEED